MKVKHKPIIVGLTGGVATGKTTAACMFRALGAEVIDADRVARAVVQPGKPALKNIITHFGRDIINKDGKLDRKKLADIVFSSKNRRALLNRLTHPHIIKSIHDLINKKRNKVVIIDAPLLFEAGMEKSVDVSVVVWSRKKDQLNRLAGKGVGRGQADLMINSQWSAERKKKMADFTIENTAGRDQLEKNVKKLWMRLTNKYKLV
jgi:dephospho-CoA kinase